MTEKEMFAAMRAAGVNPTGAYWCNDCGCMPRAGGSIRCLDCERLFVARMNKTTWSELNEPYLHGVVGTRGNRKVEVVRVELSEWECFCYIDGKAVSDLPGRGLYQQMKLEAAKWLKETQ